MEWGREEHPALLNPACYCLAPAMSSAERGGGGGEGERERGGEREREGRERTQYNACHDHSHTADLEWTSVGILLLRGCQQEHEQSTTSL